MAGAASGHPHTTQGRALVVPWALIRFGHRSLRGRRRAHGGATYLPLDSVRMRASGGRWACVCRVDVWCSARLVYTSPLRLVADGLFDGRTRGAHRMRADRWMVFFSGIS